ncbi:MAG: hypothetical protein NTW10_14310 [Bacteroidetes bacterium]|nr:hypothetical protein [Bacteroidota bacterium]
MTRWISGFILFPLCFLFMEGNAQIPASDSLPPSAENVSRSTSLPLHKLHVGVQAGTQFTTTSGYGSGFSTYLSPTLTYPVSKRFLISGGISVVNTNLFGYRPYYSFGEGPSYSGNFTQATLWVSGQYMLSNRLVITGTAYKTFDILGDNPNARFYKSTPQGAYFNVGYKINDFMHIEAGFGYSQGTNGYSFGCPGMHGFGSPLYDPFLNR